MSLPSDESSENLFLQDTFQDALQIGRAHV
jgi:hypothetical protein